MRIKFQFSWPLRKLLSQWSNDSIFVFLLSTSSLDKQVSVKRCVNKFHNFIQLSLIWQNMNHTIINFSGCTICLNPYRFIWIANYISINIRILHEMFDKHRNQLSNLSIKFCFSQTHEHKQNYLAFKSWLPRGVLSPLQRHNESLRLFWRQHSIFWQ